MSNERGEGLLGSELPSACFKVKTSRNKYPNCPRSESLTLSHLCCIVQYIQQLHGKVCAVTVWPWPSKCVDCCLLIISTQNYK